MSWSLEARSTPLVLSLSIIGAHSQLFQDTLWTGHHSVTLIRVKHMWWHTVVHIFPLSCQWFVFLRFIFLCVFAIKLENRWIIESLILIITTGIQSWFCFQSGDGNVMFGGRQESVWLFGWPRANRQPGDGVFQWADCFLSHSFHIKLNNWIFKFVRFLLTCAAGGQQAGRIKRGSIHLKGLVTFFSYTSVHLKKKKVWSSVSSVLPVVRCLQREQTPVV